MMKKKELINNTDEQNSKLDAIKNLIFGDNIVEYDSTFAEIKEDIDVKEKQLKDYIDSVKNELEQHIDSVVATINKELKELDAKLETKASALEAKKVDKKQLSKLLIALGEKIGG